MTGVQTCALPISSDELRSKKVAKIELHEINLDDLLLARVIEIVKAG